MAGITVVQGTPGFIFVSPLNPTVYDAISIRAGVDTAAMFWLPQNAVPIEQINLVVSLLESNLTAVAHNLTVSTYAPRTTTVPRRLNRSAWQARLGSKMDPIKRKVLDNQLLLSSHPTDMLRIRTTRDSRSQDIQTRTIVSNEILPILLPTMKDVPMRRLVKDDASESITVTFAMTDADNAKPFEAYCPLAGQLQRDDLLFRIIEDPYADLPYLMVLQVKDELATLAYSSMLYVKYNLTFYDEALPQAVVNAVVAASTKRGKLAW